MLHSLGTPLRNIDTPSEFKRHSVALEKKAGAIKNWQISTKTVTSISNQRQHVRIFEDGSDVTPKQLFHKVYRATEDGQRRTPDTLGLARGPNSISLEPCSSKSGHDKLQLNPVLPIKSISLQIQPIQQFQDVLVVEEKFSLDAASEHIDNNNAQLGLPRCESRPIHVTPNKVNIILRETETFFIYELPQLTADLSTEEGMAVKRVNEQYEYITIGHGSNRKLADVETQTPCIYTKSRGTYLARSKKKNHGTFVNNWVMHDTYSKLNLGETEDTIVIDTAEALAKSLAKQANPTRLSVPQENVGNLSPEKQMAYLAEKSTFVDAVLIIERIIASNLFIIPQKRFKGLIKQDPYSPSLQFTYSLDLLWSYESPLTAGQTVSCFAWNNSNSDILAAAYGPIRNLAGKQGLVMIWTAKNPQKYGRSWYFNSPISAMDWSRERPNLLAIGLYNGIVQIIDASSKDLVIIRCSSRVTSPSYEPHWQVQWWTGDEEDAYEEQIYTSNQDGRIFRYRTENDFGCTEMMRIGRMEGKIEGVNLPNRCIVNDIQITQHPGALILRRHPEHSLTYFVGSDEGCIHCCSTTHLQRHVDVFLAHNGPVNAMQFSPFCSKIFLTCGADWCTRIWADGITSPLITLSTRMACVQGAAWSPKNSTIIATIVNNEINVWDIKRKTYTPTSVTVCNAPGRLVLLEFTANGDQLVVADTQGAIHIYSLEGMPFHPYNQIGVLVASIERELITKPRLFKALKKLGKPF